MNPEFVLELEDGACTLSQVVADGGQFRITQVVSLPLTELSREGLAQSLAALPGGLVSAGAAVTVVLGERRMQHLVSIMPRMAAADVIAFVGREAVRATGQTQAGEVMFSTRLVQVGKDGRIKVACVALPVAVWRPLESAITAAGFRIVGLHSMESCLALAARRTGHATAAVLELNAGRGRFVVCEGDAPTQVRRFLVGNAADAGGAALVAQLAIELPRTMDWLLESGRGAPSALILGKRLGIEDADRAMLQGDFRAIEPAVSKLKVVGDVEPGLAVRMLLEEGGKAQRLPSLLAEPELHLPMPASVRLAAAALLVLGLSGSAFATIESSVWWEAKRQCQLVAQSNEQLQMEQAGLAQSVAERAQPPTGQSKLLSVLQLRRPTSRLLAEVSQCAGGQLHLEELRFASTERTQLVGVVEGDSRTAALAALAEFVRRLRGLPYLEPQGQEEVGEVPGSQNQFRFKIALAWRHS